jgi:leucyl aminopeptidase
VSLAFTVAAPPADRVEAELLAVPIGAGRVLGPGADVVDAALDGGLDEFMQEADFQGKPGESLAVPTRARLRADAAILVGVGKFNELTADGLRRAAASVARKARKVASVATTLVDLSDAAGLERSDAAQAVAEGFVLGSYQFVN